MKPVLARQMEVYAGFLEHTDHHVGRLVDALESLGVLEDTLVYYIVGDNGASAEGTINGTFNEMFVFNGAAALETPEFVASRIDEFGTPSSYGHFAVGWAHAMDTPYQWTKQVASHWGGTRNGTIVHWPRGFKARGEVRSQFHHVIDVAPTVLEAAGLPQPTTSTASSSIRSKGRACATPSTARRRRIAARRSTSRCSAIAVSTTRGGPRSRATRSPGWWGTRCRPFEDDVWELYEPGDWSQANDRADEQPEKLEELQALWLEEARRHNVLPLDDRRIERFNAELVGRPELVKGNSQMLFGGMGRLSENSILNVKNKSHAVTAEVVVPDGGAAGRDHRPGRRLRRLEPLREGRQADLLLQPARPAALQDPGRYRDPSGNAPGAHGVRVRRRRARQGRHGHAVRRRRRGGRGPRRRHRPAGVLRGRDDRRRLGHRVAGQRRLRACATTCSTVAWSGCKSTSARTPRTRIT